MNASTAPIPRTLTLIFLLLLALPAVAIALERTGSVVAVQGNVVTVRLDSGEERALTLAPDQLQASLAPGARIDLSMLEDGARIVVQDEAAMNAGIADPRQRAQRRPAAALHASAALTGQERQETRAPQERPVPQEPVRSEATAGAVDRSAATEAEMRARRLAAARAFPDRTRTAARLPEPLREDDPLPPNDQAITPAATAAALPQTGNRFPLLAFAGLAALAAGFVARAMLRS